MNREKFDEFLSSVKLNKKRLYEKKAPAWHVGAFYRRKGFGILKCRIGEEHEKRTSM